MPFQSSQTSCSNKILRDRHSKANMDKSRKYTTTRSIESISVMKKKEWRSIASFFTLLIGCCNVQMSLAQSLCSLCPNSEVVPRPNDVALADGTTCVSIAVNAIFSSGDESQCRDYYQYIGYTKCGCDLSPSSSNNNDDGDDEKCTICPAGSTLTLPNAQFDSITDTTCSDANNYLQHFQHSHDACASFQSNARDKCGCVTASPTMTPTASVVPSSKPSTKASNVPSVSISNAPSVAPSPLPCEDDPDFTILIDSATGRRESCSWIDDAYMLTEVQARREAQCSKLGVRQACKRACGKCCADNASHLFPHDLFDDKEIVNCHWLSENLIWRDVYCGWKQGSCPESCGVCPLESNQSPAPSQYPTAEPKESPTSSQGSYSPTQTLEIGRLTSPTATCEDDPNFTILINVSTGRTASCSWIDDAYQLSDVEFRREKQCSKPDVQQACRRACGECCGDNTAHVFNHIQPGGGVTWVNCHWLTENLLWRDAYCGMKQGSCPESCGICPTNRPTASPTIQPTVSPTVLPTSSPSNSPSKELSLKPSVAPTSPPTNIGSYIPSVMHSSNPSEQFSSRPSSTLSTSPSLLPSSLSSGTPSIYTSSRPSIAPSITLSSRPTINGSASPSSEPTIKTPPSIDVVAPSSSSPTISSTSSQAPTTVKKETNINGQVKEVDGNQSKSLVSRPEFFISVAVGGFAVLVIALLLVRRERPINMKRDKYGMLPSTHVRSDNQHILFQSDSTGFEVQRITNDDIQPAIISDQEGEFEGVKSRFDVDLEEFLDINSERDGEKVDNWIESARMNQSAFAPNGLKKIMTTSLVDIDDESSDIVSGSDVFDNIDDKSEWSI